MNLSTNQIYKKVNPSVFCITTTTSTNKYSGTGFFIDDKGNAVTNYHVIKDAFEAEVTMSDDKKYQIDKVVGCDEANDIAIVHINILNLTL